MLQNSKLQKLKEWKEKVEEEIHKTSSTLTFDDKEVSARKIMNCFARANPALVKVMRENKMSFSSIAESALREFKWRAHVRGEKVVLKTLAGDFLIVWSVFEVVSSYE